MKYKDLCGCKSCLMCKIIEDNNLSEMEVEEELKGGEKEDDKNIRS